MLTLAVPPQDEVILADPWADRTNVHPLGLAAVIVLGATTLLLPRRYALIPLAVLACLVPSGQRVVLAGLDFTFLRLMILVGWIRVFARGEYRSLKLRPLDTVMILWAVVGSLVYITRWGSVDAVIRKLGESFDALGMYFLVRFLLQNWLDLDRIAAAFAWISVLVLGFLFVERVTGRNVFSVLGGVPEFTAIRSGRLRCQGAFSHPILAGCFWVSLLPLVAARWWAGGSARMSALIGVAGTFGIVLLTASSTPVLGLMMVILGAAAFRFRRSMRPIRWTLLVVLVSLHLVMNAPVWHLIARIDVISGSTGWHRFHLIDEALARIGEWWMLGTMSTSHWGIQLFDLTNQYILEGVRGGLATLVLFIVSISLAFGNVGRITRRAAGPRQRALGWGLGVSLFAQTVIFFAVSYFGQILLVWYLVLAATASLDLWTARAPAGHRRQARPPGRTPRVLVGPKHA